MVKNDQTMSLSDEQRFALALHLRGFYFHEKYQECTDIEKLAHILLDADFSESILLAEKTYEAHQKKNIHTLFFFDHDYPYLLKNIYDPPFALFCLGNQQLIERNKVSMVGTRQPSIVAVKSAEFISDHLSSQKITLVSGMAHGIDTACHKASYQNAGGTIAVLAHGLDYVYPKANHHLYQLAYNQENPGCSLSPNIHWVPSPSAIIFQKETASSQGCLTAFSS